MSDADLTCIDPSGPRSAEFGALRMKSKTDRSAFDRFMASVMSPALAERKLAAAVRSAHPDLRGQLRVVADELYGELHRLLRGGRVADHRGAMRIIMEAYLSKDLKRRVVASIIVCGALERNLPDWE